MRTIFGDYPEDRYMSRQVDQYCSREPNVCVECEGMLGDPDDELCHTCYCRINKMCEFCGEEIEGVPMEDCPMTCVKCFEEGDV